MGGRGVFAGLKFRTIAALGVFCVAAALPAVGQAVQCVDPAGGGCKKKIQAAIDAAAPGEEIQVNPGYYAENLTIATEGVVLVGTGRFPQGVVIDGRRLGHAVSIVAEGVVVRNLKVQNGAQHGIYIDAPRVQVIGVKVAASDASAVYVASGARHALIMNSTLTLFDAPGVHLNESGAAVVGCYISTGDGDGIRATGDNSRLENNAIRNCEDDNGIEVDGHRALVRGNEISGIDSSGVEIDGDDALVEGNRLFAGDGDGLEIDGARNMVRDNVISAMYDSGIDIGGDRMKVVNNVIRDLTDDEGIDLDCNGCTAALVAGNLIYNIPDDDDGMDLWTDGPGLVVRNNLIHHVTESGIYLSASGAQVLNNTVHAAGTEEEGAFEIWGSDNLVQGNYAYNNNGEGFLVAGSNNRISGNSAKRNYREGFFVQEGDGNRLLGNEAKGGYDDGIFIAVGATNTVVKRNISLGNSAGFWDFQDEGPGTVLGTGWNANTFGTIAP